MHRYQICALIDQYSASGIWKKYKEKNKMALGHCFIKMQQ